MRLSGVSKRKNAGMALAVAALGLFLRASALHAQTPPGQTEAGPEELKLRGIEDSLKAGDDERRRAEARVERERNDRARLEQGLIDTTARERAAETQVAATEKRLDTALASEEAIRRSLDGRRDTIADVLAALQRIGRKPPPAVLASPDDILRAVRASMLLGAVLPELRAETEALASDLEDLIKVRKGVADERQRLVDEQNGLIEERQRLAGLVEARQAALAEAQGALAAENAKMAELARKSSDLKDLIARSELESVAAARGAEAARNADANAGKAPTGPLRDPARLAPAIAFNETKGSVLQPVTGALVRAFGELDSLGAKARGVTFATSASAVVTAPCDGWISYSGPWRSFGQLLIINAGGGYYMVLAGMDHVNVVIGQFVLAGEPVAGMGDGSARNAVTISIGANQPVLYVELWKDGSTVDPGPWWAKPENEKVRG